MTAADDTSSHGRARQVLRDALAGGDALAALGASLRWAAEVLAERRDDDGVAALEGVFDLYDALEEVPALAAEAPLLVAAARPGERPAEQLDKRLAELTALHERLRADRTALERLADAEDELRRRLADHAELRDRIAELRRLERLVDTLDALSGQHQVVDERLKALRSRDTSAERTLTADCGALVRLSEDQLDALAPRTREALRQAEESGERLAAEERELARVTSELDERSRRLEEVRAALGERIPQLERYARADRELAEALSAWGHADGDGSGGAHGDRLVKTGTALERARLAAADVERRLGEIDRVLREALD
jgi:DNA repair exonuclease SbcCD ATPase subunit